MSEQVSSGPQTTVKEVSERLKPVEGQVLGDCLKFKNTFVCEGAWFLVTSVISINYSIVFWGTLFHQTVSL